MTLSDWIENKKSELVEQNGFRSIELRSIEKCVLTRNSTKTIYDIGVSQDNINTDIQVKEVIRNELTDREVDGFEVVFDVVKPRCRKETRHRVYVMPV